MKMPDEIEPLTAGQIKAIDEAERNLGSEFQPNGQNLSIVVEHTETEDLIRDLVSDFVDEAE